MLRRVAGLTATQQISDDIGESRETDLATDLFGPESPQTPIDLATDLFGPDEATHVPSMTAVTIPPAEDATNASDSSSTDSSSSSDTDTSSGGAHVGHAHTPAKRPPARGARRSTGSKAPRRTTKKRPAAATAADVLPASVFYKPRTPATTSAVRKRPSSASNGTPAANVGAPAAPPSRPVQAAPSSRGSNRTQRHTVTIAHACRHCNIAPHHLVLSWYDTCSDTL